MAEGTEFFTVGSHSGKAVEVTPLRCSCGVEQITAESDDEEDDNLDGLPECPQ
jgi:hypothetical protein